MFAAQNHAPKLTPTEYFAWEEQQYPQLQDYVLVSSHDIAIDLYRKNEAGHWEIINYRAGDIIELQSINLSFPIEQVYRGIDFSKASIELPPS